MEVNSLQILLVDVTFYIQHIQNVVQLNETRLYTAPAVKGLNQYITE